MKYKNKPLDSPLETALEAIGGKWKPIILWKLYQNSECRYSELKRLINGISEKMLIQSLKELASDGIIQRNEFKSVPPTVSYVLTSKAEGTKPILRNLNQWGVSLIDENSKFRTPNSKRGMNKLRPQFSLSNEVVVFQAE